MKKLVSIFISDFINTFYRKPTREEIKIFKIGVKAGIDAVHTNLHNEIDKIVKIKK